MPKLAFRPRSHLRRRILRPIVLALGAMLLNACDSEGPTEPEGPPATHGSVFSATATEGSVDYAKLGFDLRIEIAGTLKPYEPVRITATAKPLLPFARARLVLQMPEYQLATRYKWEGFRIPLNESIPEIAAVEEPLGTNESVTLSSTITVPAEGSFRVVARIEATGEGEVSHPWVQDVVSEQVWITIDEEGGLIHPAHEVPVQLGPRWPRRRSGSGIGQQATEVPAPGGSCYYGDLYVCVFTGYYDHAEQKYYFANSEVFIEYYDPYSGDLIGGEGPIYPDDEAIVPATCPYSLDEALVNMNMSVNDPHLAIGTKAGEWFNSIDCGYHINAGYPYQDWMGKVIDNLHATIDAIPNAFGTSTSSLDRVEVYIEQLLGGAAGKYNAFYNRIKIDPDWVWGGSGVLVAAHEYGHKTHDYNFGGYSGGTCVDERDYNHAHNPQCAHTEGFADFFALATRGTATGRVTAYENNTNPVSGEDKVQVPTAVAAFYWDVFDAANEAHDGLSLPGSYLRDVLQSCLVKIFDWDGEFSIDTYIYCLNAGFDTATRDTYFAPGTHNIGWTIIGASDGVSEPSGWSRSGMEALWKKNLFDLQ